MKKIILSSLLYLVFSTALFAQKANDLADLNAVLAKTPEIKAGGTVTSDMMNNALEVVLEKSVIWNILWDKNPYQKVEEAEGCPIAYYKRSSNVIVLIYVKSNKNTETIAHGIDVATFNTKTGKRVDGLVMVGAFGGTTAGFAEITISADLKTFTCSNVMPRAGDNSVVFDITEKGAIKDKK